MKFLHRILLFGYVAVALFLAVGVPIIEFNINHNYIVLSQDEFVNEKGLKLSPLLKYNNNYAQDVGLDGQNKTYTAKLFGVFNVGKKNVITLPSDDFKAGGFAIGFDAILKDSVILDNGCEKNTTSGIGTLTVINPKNNRFVALGHKVTDYDTGKEVSITNGNVYQCNVLNIEKSKSNKIGKFNATIDCCESQGSLHGSSVTGIFGCLKADSVFNEMAINAYKLTSRYSVKPGKAKLLTSIDGVNPVEYDISIIKTYSQKKASSKSFLIRINDKRLIENTGGIVHGMSGSPIIQNGKIVGALTHVLLKDATLGYGVYIDWMVDESANK